jgi:FkbM family methyltransferase
MAMTIDDYEKLNPVCKVDWGGREITFATPNSFTVYRVQSLPTKEPDTMSWIASFGPNDVLLDIGANVGMYSIWAAASRGTRVYAFEPESQNYAILNKNIFLNRFADRVTAYCVALSDQPGFGDLNLTDFRAGASCHTFGEMVDFKLEPKTPVFSQGCYATTVDAVVSAGQIPVPKHIKIDVDGIEHKVIAGARETLRNPALKSVLVELNTNLEIHRRIIDDMCSLGFSFSAAQAEAAIRKDGLFKGVGNHIFRR